MNATEDARPCAHCGREIPNSKLETHANWLKRKFCSRACGAGNASSNRARAAGYQRVELVEQLIAAGEAPAQIAATMGIKVESLARWLDRRGHAELARPFNRGINERPAMRRRCGTRQAYLDHGKRGEPTDDMCRAANNAYMARRREREAAGIHANGMFESGTPPMRIRPADWTQSAECAKYDPTWWDGEDLSKAAQAAAICRQCPVAAQCLAEGLALHEKYGMRAGKFPKDWKMAS